MRNLDQETDESLAENTPTFKKAPITETVNRKILSTLLSRKKFYKILVHKLNM